jgi:protein-S-isoprenylcysteine O-methyltransferase Ste14
MCPKDIEKYIARHRADISSEHTFGDIGQLVLFILFMTVWITDAFIIRYSTILNDYIPFLIIRMPLGIILVVLAIYLLWAGTSLVFGDIREEQNIIDQGVFGWLRHPVYIGEALFYLGLIMFSISLVATGVWIITIVFLHYISRYEEKVLLERYGEEYRQYMRDVPMYLPRIIRKKKL